MPFSLRWTDCSQAPDANVIVEDATLNTPYRNTIPLEDQPVYPGDIELEEKLENIIRWLQWQSVPHYVLLPRREYERLKGPWQLPQIP